MSFFAVIYTITAIFLPHYIPVYFYIQHVSLFLFASMLVYYFISLGYKRFRKYFKRKQILYGYSVLLFGLALYLISDMQAYIIDTYQVSNYESCLYYDENGLLLYNGYLIFVITFSSKKSTFNSCFNYSFVLFVRTLSIL